MIFESLLRVRLHEGKVLSLRINGSIEAPKVFINLVIITYTHTHHTHTLTHTHTHTHAHIHSHTHTLTHTYTHTHAHTHSLTHSLTHMHNVYCACVYTSRYVQASPIKFICFKLDRLLCNWCSLTNNYYYF